jgi:hypothetical protein
VETLGACEPDDGPTSAEPKPPEFVVAGTSEVEVEVEVFVVAAVAGWPERASPIVATNARTEPRASPRLANVARRRAILMGRAGIVLNSITLG